MSLKNEQTNLLVLLFFTFAALPPIIAHNSTVTLKRATSTAIFFHVPCVANETCNVLAVKYQLMANGTKNNLLNPQKEASERENGTFAIRSLKSGSLYNITVFMHPDDGNVVSTSFFADTCPEKLPAVSGLRIVKAGPGWIDIRWKSLYDTSCRSNIVYFIRYGAENQTMGLWMPMGMFLNGDGKEVFSPLHPCEAWPAEFCVLLTDRVKSAEKHKIEVMGGRYDPADFSPNTTSHSEKALIWATANASLTGKYLFGVADSLSPCVPPSEHMTNPKTTAAPSGNGARQGRSHRTRSGIPAWVAVIVVVAMVVVIIPAGITACVLKKKKKRKVTENFLTSKPNVPSTPDICASVSEPSQNSNQIPPQTDVGRISNVYDDCQDMTQPETGYERLKCKAPTTCFKQPTQHQQSIYINQHPAHGTSNPQNNVYVPMGPISPLYDDAQDIIQRSQNVRESEDYLPPRQIPSYTEVLEHVPSPDYNRPYSTVTPDKWKGWT